MKVNWFRVPYFNACFQFVIITFCDWLLMIMIEIRKLHLWLMFTWCVHLIIKPHKAVCKLKIFHLLKIKCYCFWIELKIIVNYCKCATFNNEKHDICCCIQLHNLAHFYFVCPLSGHFLCSISFCVPFITFDVLSLKTFSRYISWRIFVLMLYIAERML